MSRPQGVKQGVRTGSAGNTIDATICAHAGTTIERRYTAADTQRLREAGAQEGTAFTAIFGFSQLEGRVAIDGELEGVVVLTCQRCMRPFEWQLQEAFQVVLVRTEADLEQEPANYEAIVADPAHADLLALAEDQALLALPLVPKHEAENCDVAEAPAVSDATEARGTIDEKGDAELTTQRPFGNLRDLMRGH
jgi:uncharacterized protein